MLNAYNRLGWADNLDDANEITLQTTAIRVLCRAGYQACVNRANQFYNDWAEFNVPVPSNFKSIVFTTFIESGDNDDWHSFYDRALAEKNEAEKLRMLRALTDSKDLSLLTL